MSKAAFVILAAGDQPESLDRVVNALMGALEYIESGSEVQVIFDGAGTQAAAELAKPDHKYHDLFAKVRDRVTGVCSCCAGAYDVKDKIEAWKAARKGQSQARQGHRATVEVLPFMNR